MNFHLDRHLIQTRSETFFDSHPQDSRFLLSALRQPAIAGFFIALLKTHLVNNILFNFYFLFLNLSLHRIFILSSEKTRAIACIQICSPVAHPN
jgi:hypothetical protein